MNDPKTSPPTLFDWMGGLPRLRQLTTVSDNMRSDLSQRQFSDVAVTVSASNGRGLADAFRTAFRGEVISIDPIAEGADQDFEPHIAYYKAEKPGESAVAQCAALADGAPANMARDAPAKARAASFFFMAGLQVSTGGRSGPFVPPVPTEPTTAADVGTSHPR